ncbi:MAG TPA: serine hydrolase domain-containing protein [Pseudonocardiaceae bacterium]
MDIENLLVRGRLSALLDELAHDHHVPGAQLDIRWRQHRFAAVSGREEYGTDRPVTPRSKIPAGSIGKAFTATVAMMLVADGDLVLDDPVGEYLRGAHDLFGRLTPRQLLSHTSGLPSSLDDCLPASATTSARRYLAECARQTVPVCPPGTAFSYSNVGYVLVGHLIEVITGLAWHQAVESILLRPLGIEPAFVVTADRDTATGPISPGHAVNPATGRAQPVSQTVTPAAAAVGALALSASDLAAFAALHLPDGPDLLDRDMIELMRQPVPGAEPFGLADGWGLGLAVFGRWVGHDGTGDGTSCHLRIDPAESCVIACTCNANTGNLLWQDLVTELRAAGLPVADYQPPVALDRPLPPPPECFGQYVNGDNEYSIARRDGRPCVAVAGEIFPELAVHDRGVFSVRDPVSGRRINGGRFLANPRTGRINSLQTGGRIARRLEPAA